MHNEPIILGVDPGTRFMGIAVIQGLKVLAYGVHTLHNGDHPHDLIGQAKSVVLTYVQEHNPDVIALEAPLRLATQTAALLSVIDQELAARGTEVNTRVVRLSPQEVRQKLTGNPMSNKLEVATHLLGIGFSTLADKLPKTPARAVLGYKPKERYWLHVFDALAVAVAASH